MDIDARGFIFGYGSLVDRRHLNGLARKTSEFGYVATLRGFRRTWGVAMDNSQDIPGYKFYEHHDGQRALGHVAFLDIEQYPNAGVNGVCLPVTPATANQLCTRERNYELIEVTKSVTPSAPAGCKVFAFVGRCDSRARASAARESGELLVQREYVDHVEAQFEGLGESEMSHYRASTESARAPGLRVVRLRRVDIPDSQCRFNSTIVLGGTRGRA